jgi:hypothetical protein
MASVYYKKYKRLSGMDVVRHVDKLFKDAGSPLTEYQRHILEKYWGEPIGNYGDLNLPFQAYEWKDIKYKGVPLMRLTFPIFVIFIILMTFVVRPLNWLVRGSWWFDKNSKIEVLCNKWWILIFGE